MGMEECILKSNGYSGSQSEKAEHYIKNLKWTVMHLVEQKFCKLDLEFLITNISLIVFIF